MPAQWGSLEVRPGRRRPVVVTLIAVGVRVVILAQPACRAGLSGRDRTEIEVTSFVAEGGDDSKAGRADAPFATLGRALEAPGVETVVLEAGTYAETMTRILRPVRIRSRGGVLEGHLEIAAPGVELFGLRVTEGVSVTASGSVRIETTTIAAGRNLHALSFESAKGGLEDVTLDCGRETCLSAKSSTITATHLRVRPSATTKRGVRATFSRIALDDLTVTGSVIAQVQVERASNAELRNATLAGAEGSGVVVIGRSNLILEQTSISNANNTALVVDRSHASINGLEASATRGPTVGLAGGSTSIRGSRIAGSPAAALNLSRKRDSGELSIEGGEILHGRFVGLSVGSGDVKVRGTRFVGDPRATENDGGGIEASGLDARIDVEATFDAPGSFAVSITRDASGSVTATVTRPGLGGVLVDSATTDRVRVVGSVIDGCVAGSGVVILDSIDLLVDRTRVTHCAEAGVLAGNESQLQVVRSLLKGNGRYGVAAFGGSVIRVDETHVSGSRWATYATCSDGAEIIDGEGNILEGPSVACPSAQ